MYIQQNDLMSALDLVSINKVLLSFILIYIIYLKFLVNWLKDFFYNKKNLLGGLGSFFFDTSKNQTKCVFIGINLFIIIIYLNFIGLVPFTLSITSHSVTIMFFSILIFFSYIISSFLYKPLYFFSHLTPLGSPLIIGLFLNVVEVISLFIRPLTLSLRLSINITTGHIFVRVFSSGVVAIKSLLYKLSLLILLGYKFFEVFVGLIQSFVFSTLTIKYLSEHSTSYLK